MYSKLCKMEKKISEVLLWIGGACVLFGTVLTFISVILRYGFGISYNSWEELIRWILLYDTFLLMGYVMLKDQNVSMTVISGMIKSRRAKGSLDFAMNVIVIVFAFLMGVYGVQLVQASMNTMSPSGKRPMNMGYISLPVGMFVLVFYTVIKLLMRFSKPKDQTAELEDSPATDENGEPQKGGSEK